MSFRHQRPERAGRFVLRRRPIEAVLFAGCALELLGVIYHSAGGRVRAGILPLGGHISPANANGAEFVLADVAIDDFFLARRRVEMPLPVRLHQRNRHRPVVRAHFQRDFVVALF